MYHGPEKGSVVGVREKRASPIYIRHVYVSDGKASENGSPESSAKNVTAVVIRSESRLQKNTVFVPGFPLAKQITQQQGKEWDPCCTLHFYLLCSTLYVLSFIQ